MANITSAIDVLRDHQQHFLNRKLARSPLLQFFTGAYRLDIHRLFEHITPNTPAIKGDVGVSTPTAFLKNMLEGRLEAVIHNIPTALIKKLQKIQAAHIDNLNARGQHTLYLAYPCIVLPDEEKKSPKFAPIFLFKIDIVINDVKKVVIKRVAEANGDGTEKLATSAVFNRLLAAHVKIKHQVELSFDSEKLSFNGQEIESALDGVLQNWSGLNKTLRYPKVSKVPDKKSIKHLNIDKDDPYIADCALIGITEFSGQETLDDLEKIIKKLDDGEECPQVLNSLVGIAQNNQSLEGRKPKSDNDKWLIEKSDPSQEKVIWTHGENLLTVLQGPPGTGKSQTIVNLIADALVQKKSVLVVCQKRAAIDVVLKRLSAKGLKDLAILVEDVDKDRQQIIKDIRGIEREISGSSDRRRDSRASSIEQLETEVERNIKALNDTADNRIRYKHIKARLSKLPKPTRHAELSKFRSKVATQSGDNDALSQLLQQIKQVDDTIKETDYVNNAWRDVKVTLAKHPKDLDCLIEFAKEVKRLSDWILAQEIKPQYTKDTHWVMAHPWLVGDSISSLRGFLAGKENHEYEIYEKFCELINKLQIISKHNPQIKALDYVDKIFSPDTQWNENLKKLVHDAGHLRRIVSLRNQIANNEMLQELQSYGVKHGVNFGGWTEQIKAEALQRWLDDLREKYPEAFREIGDTKTKIQHLKIQLDEKRALDAKVLKEQFNERLTYRNQLENSNLLRLRRGGNVPKTSLRLLYNNGFEKLKNIAPLLLTSPEAASALLPLKADLFDVVVIDEASQMFVAEAIPILFRAKKVLIAGDSKQMPPADFFTNATDDDGGDVEWEDQEEQEDAMPQHIAADRIYTLLDAAENALPAGGHSRVSLDVHYRSARRELIDFSNHAFYDGKMIIPSGNAKLPSFMHSAIVFENVNGTFERGINRSEATKIIELLKDIWTIPQKERPSVGVIVANTRQRDYVEDLLIDACERDNDFKRELDLERERTDAGENVAFFVRSVEHVQGDERDVIIFGLTYSGESRAFGPLNKKEDGRKRLNVAITRAKRGMIVLNSLKILKISNEAERNVSERYYVWQYLRYAQAVSDYDIATIEAILNQLNPERKQFKIRNKQTESPFEDDVKEYIESLGYHVDCQVGESGFRIDLCVKRQATSAVYLCGIECDGAAYHTGWKARTRDVWRQEILESKGWHIERIWSTDWFDNTDTAKQALKEKLQELADITPETNNKPTEKAAFRDATVTTQKEVEVRDSVTYQSANDAVTCQVKIVLGVSDPNQGTTNHKTPLAQALLGCKEGDVTVFLSPFGKKEIRIIAITKDEQF